jgi:hypothetical protein
VQLTECAPPVNKEASAGPESVTHQIAAGLFISHRTATTHVANILGKLGIATRTEATAWAVREGLA